MLADEMASLGSAHCNENPIYVFLFWELRDRSPYFHIHVFVSDLYSPRIGTVFLIKDLGAEISAPGD
jgi:hypothetical protein